MTEACVVATLDEAVAMEIVRRAADSLESASIRLLTVPPGLGLGTACVSYGTQGDHDIWRTWGPHGDAAVQEAEHRDRPAGRGFFNLGDCAAASHRLADVIKTLRSAIPASQSPSVIPCKSIVTGVTSEIRSERPDLDDISVLLDNVYPETFADTSQTARFVTAVVGPQADAGAKNI